MTILAIKPYTKWPDIGKACFEYRQRIAPVLAYEYRELLPKE